MPTVAAAPVAPQVGFDLDRNEPPTSYTLIDSGQVYGSVYRVDAATTVTKVAALLEGVGGAGSQQLRMLVYSTTNHLPDTLVASSPLDTFAATLAKGWYEFTLSAAFTATAGTEYCIAILGGDTTQKIRLYFEDQNPGAAGAQNAQKIPANWATTIFNQGRFGVRPTDGAAVAGGDRNTRRAITEAWECDLAIDKNGVLTVNYNSDTGQKRKVGGGAITQADIDAHYDTWTGQSDFHRLLAALGYITAAPTYDWRRLKDLKIVGSITVQGNASNRTQLAAMLHNVQVEPANAPAATDTDAYGLPTASDAAWSSTTGMNVVSSVTLAGVSGTDTFKITINGVDTIPIVYDASQTTVKNAVATVVGTLNGVTNCHVDKVSSNEYRLSFIGALGHGAAAVVTATVLSGSGTATIVPRTAAWFGLDRASGRITVNDCVADLQNIVARFGGDNYGGSAAITLSDCQDSILRYFLAQNVHADGIKVAANGIRCVVWNGTVCMHPGAWDAGVTGVHADNLSSGGFDNTTLNVGNDGYGGLPTYKDVATLSDKGNASLFYTGTSIHATARRCVFSGDNKNIQKASAALYAGAGWCWFDSNTGASAFQATGSDSHSIDNRTDAAALITVGGGTTTNAASPQDVKKAETFGSPAATFGASSGPLYRRYAVYASPGAGLTQSGARPGCRSRLQRGTRRRR